MDRAARLAGVIPAMVGWRPDEFWSATPAEVSAILSPPEIAGAADGVSRAELNRLMERENHG
nr:phage tail assembly chaperone [Croceibacterium ferulae]